ncbi:MAG: MipA/OmpV family protein [Deltaproteobacteria bacterium]|nr:MipA/OmpV family protein [Deltaproteobacteria bacterium]
MKIFKLTSSLIKTAVFCLALFVTSPVSAQIQVPVDIFPNFFGFGIGFMTEYAGSKDYVAGVAPGLRLSLPNNRFIEWYGSFADINLLPSARWQLGPMVNYRFGRSDVSDPVVNKLPEIDGTFEAGVFGSYTYTNLQGIPWRLRIGLTALTNFGNVYTGVNAFGWGSFWFPVRKDIFIGLGTGAGGGSESFMNAYFGITPAGAAASGLDAYATGAGFRSVYGYPMVIWQFHPSWAAGAGLIYQRLVGGAADSPIVKERGSADQWMGGVGLGYIW